METWALQTQGDFQPLGGFFGGCPQDKLRASWETWESLLPRQAWWREPAWLQKARAPASPLSSWGRWGKTSPSPGVRVLAGTRRKTHAAGGRDRTPRLSRGRNASLAPAQGRKWAGRPLLVVQCPVMDSYCSTPNPPCLVPRDTGTFFPWKDTGGGGASLPDSGRFALLAPVVRAGVRTPMEFLPSGLCLCNDAPTGTFSDLSAGAPGIFPEFHSTLASAGTFWWLLVSLAGAQPV